MASSDFKFEIRMKNADSSKLKAMLAGLQEHFNDSTMKFYETKVIVVETKCEKVAEILKLLDVSDLTPKRRAHRKNPSPELMKKLLEEHGDEPVFEVNP